MRRCKEGHPFFKPYKTPNYTLFWVLSGSEIFGDVYNLLEYVQFATNSFRIYTLSFLSVPRPWQFKQMSPPQKKKENKKEIPIRTILKKKDKMNNLWSVFA